MPEDFERRARQFSRDRLSGTMQISFKDGRPMTWTATEHHKAGAGTPEVRAWRPDE